MKKSFALALLALSACTSAPPGPEGKRVDIVLRNAMDAPIELHASVGIFGRTILLAPGEVWRGWIPTNVSVGSVEVEIQQCGRVADPR